MGKLDEIIIKNEIFIVDSSHLAQIMQYWHLRNMDLLLDGLRPLIELIDAILLIPIRVWIFHKTVYFLLLIFEKKE